MPVEFYAEIAINDVTLNADSDISTPGIGEGSYLNLSEKPQINGVTLVGNKSTEDLNIDHVAYADNLLSPTGTTDTTPYTFRASGGSVAELHRLTGVTVAWNQLAPISPTSQSRTVAGAVTITDNRDGSYTLNGTSSSSGYLWIIPETSPNIPSYVAPNHKYFMYTGSPDLSRARGQFILYGSTAFVQQERDGRIFAAPSDFSAYTGFAFVVYVVSGYTFSNMKVAPVLFDLTQMFGSTIADAIYTMETTTAGSGVAFFRSLFPSDYYPYSAPTLASVQTSARQALDGNGNVIRSYPLDSDLTLRGIPKLTNGKLEYDGDEYLPSGQVARRYWEFDLGSVTFYQVTGHDHMFYYALSNSTTEGHARKYGNNASGVAFQVNGYTFWGNNTSANIYEGIGNMQVAGFATTYSIVIRNDSCSTPAELKTALNGVHIVYPLETPTTETADPYTEVQLAGTTEQFVTQNDIPVGNESFYPTDLTNVVQNLAPLPTSAGTYKLQVTVSGGVPSYSWVAG